MPVSSELELVEIPPCSGTAFRLPAGSILHVIDPLGEQVADLVAFDARDPREALSNGRTFDYASTIRLTTGHVLYSNRSRALLTIEHDDVGVHDFLLTPCSRDTWRICYQNSGDRRPGCHGNLVDALCQFGIEADAIPTTFNIFMNVDVGAEGTFVIGPPRSRPGDAITLRAERDLVIGLTACSAATSNNGRFKPIRYGIRSKEYSSLTGRAIP